MNLGAKNILDKRKYYVKIGPQNNLGPRIFFGRKKILIQNSFSVQKSAWTGQTIFGLEKEIFYKIFVFLISFFYSNT